MQYHSPKRPVGRPRKPIDRERVRYLAKIHCPIEEIAVKVGCSPETLRLNYQQDIDMGKADGNIAVREDQFKASRKGCPQAFLHLGKHWLNQREEIIIKDEHKDDIKSLLSGLVKEYPGSKAIDPADKAQDDPNV